jgi:hypothetical protein
MSQWSVSKRRLALVTAALLLINFTAAGAETAPPTGGVETGGEKIVFFRHGEKPSGGLGQLDCQGLNRALKLPEVLKNKFGKPKVIFAPDPRDKVEDDHTEYYYVRPLATIEPTAIKFGMPVNTDYGFSQIGELQKELLNSKHSTDLIFVVWEHKKLIELVKNIVEKGGGSSGSVPDWPSDDYDTILVLHVTHEPGSKITVKWDKEKEGLDKEPTECPTK